MKQEEFTEASLIKLNEQVKSKTVSSINTGYGEEWNNGLLIINFSDGSKLDIEYDWLYGWSYTGNVND
jgi:hypothetical protein